jgi:hypothetical protein
MSSSQNILLQNQNVTNQSIILQNKNVMNPNVTAHFQDKQTHKQMCLINVIVEVIMAVTMKNVVFWYVMLCGSCKNRRFRGLYRLHLQGGNNQQTRNALAATSNSSMLQRINHYM